MKKRPAVRVRNVFLLLLLALVCIAGAELVVCRFADPPLFREITAPVRSGWNAAMEAVETEYLAFRRQAAARAKARAEAREARRLARLAAKEAAQQADAPAVEAEYVPADPAITELSVIEGREVLLGGNVPLYYYNQGDIEWAGKPYGDDTIGVYGCGPTALAMAVSSLTETRVDPAEMAVWAAENGYCAPRSGSYHSIVNAAAERYGLRCVSLAGTDAEEIGRRLVMSGGICVALMGPGHFTRGGHFILIHGVTLSGDMLVADPNSRERSTTTWDPELLAEELFPAADNGAPIWLLSSPELYDGQPPETTPEAPAETE